MIIDGSVIINVMNGTIKSIGLNDNELYVHEDMQENGIINVLIKTFKYISYETNGNVIVLSKDFESKNEISNISNNIKFGKIITDNFIFGYMVREIVSNVKDTDIHKYVEIAKILLKIQKTPFYVSGGEYAYEGVTYNSNCSIVKSKTNSIKEFAESRLLTSDLLDKHPILSNPYVCDVETNGDLSNHSDLIKIIKTLNIDEIKTIMFKNQKMHNSPFFTAYALSLLKESDKILLNGSINIPIDNIDNINVSALIIDYYDLYNLMQRDTDAKIMTSLYGNVIGKNVFNYGKEIKSYDIIDTKINFSKEYRGCFMVIENTENDVKIVLSK